MACYANKAKWILWGVQYNKTSWCAGSGGGYGAGTDCSVCRKEEEQIAIFKKGPRGAPMMGRTALLVRLY